MRTIKALLYVLLAILYFIKTKIEEFFIFIFRAVVYLFAASEDNFNKMVDSFQDLMGLEEIE